MNKLFTKITSLALGAAMMIGVGVSVGSKKVSSAYAADGDRHSITGFTGEGVSTVVNNGTCPANISVTNPGYPIKQVIIGWKHNKSNDGITASVSIGDDSLGSGTVGGQNKTTTTTIGDGNTSLSGDVSITWSNSMSGTGKGTLYINTLTFVEGVSSGDTYTVSFNGNGAASGTMADVPNISGNYTLPACGYTPESGKAFAGWKANNAGDLIAAGGSYKVESNVTFYAQWADAYSVTYTAGTNGSGSFEHSSQPAGNYTLLDFAELTGVSANTGYRFKNYTVAGVDKDPGDTITLSAALAVTVNFEEKPAETTYDFTKNFTTYANGWSGYGTHEGLSGVEDIGGDYAATIDLYYASKQSGTISDRPVFASKTGSGSWTKVLQFTLNEEGYKIDTITVTFAQWSTKTPDVALFKGNSTSGTAIDTATIGTENTLTASDFNGTTFTIGYCDKSTSSNIQSGLTSIYIALVPLSSFGTLDHITITSLPNVVYHVGETFNATSLSVTAYDGADEATANFKDVTASVETDLDNPTPFVDNDVPGFDCDVQYTGDGGSDITSFHVYVYALAQYELVTTEPTDWSGQYLIVGTNSSSELGAMNGGLDNPDVEGGYKVVTDSEGVIEAGQELEWTIAAVSGGYSVQGKSGKYIGSLTAKNNGMLVSDTALVNTLSISGSNVSIAGTNSYSLSLNTTGDRFRYYSGGTVQLYRLKSSDVADVYAQLFLDTLQNKICEYNETTGEVTTDFDSLKTAWKTLATSYNSDLSSVEKEQFRLGVASETGTNIEKALALYDHIGRVYNTRLQDSDLTNYNFMDRSSAQASPRLISNVFSEANTPVTVVIIISVIGVTALGGFFFLRKRKEI